MRRMGPWIGSTVLALLALALGVAPFARGWPRPVLFGFAAVVLLAVLLTYPRRRDDGMALDGKRTESRFLLASDSTEVTVEDNTSDAETFADLTRTSYVRLRGNRHQRDESDE